MTPQQYAEREQRLQNYVTTIEQQCRDAEAKPRASRSIPIFRETISARDIIIKQHHNTNL